MAMLALPRVFSVAAPKGVRRSADSARLLRINLLLLAALAMGAADLGCTLAYMTSIGMVELNPIARHMIRIGGAEQLVLYKLFTMAVSSGCIYLIRRHPKAEVCAWFCFAVMVWLTLHWLQYNRVAPNLTGEFSLLAYHADTTSADGWVSITN